MTNKTTNTKLTIPKLRVGMKVCFKLKGKHKARGFLKYTDYLSWGKQYMITQVLPYPNTAVIINDLGERTYISVSKQCPHLGRYARWFIVPNPSKQERSHD